MINILALFGKAGSGKDTIQNLLLDTSPLLHKIISCTTRPKREYEVDGVDYNFISKEDFTYLVNKGNMIEALEFNDWFYGTQFEALTLNPEIVNIGIYSPSGIECLLKSAAEFNLNIGPVYIKADDKVRLMRQLNREENPDIREILRRWSADDNDFMSLPFNYRTLNNNISPMNVVDILRTMSVYVNDFFG